MLEFEEKHLFPSIEDRWTDKLLKTIRQVEGYVAPRFGLISRSSTILPKKLTFHMITRKYDINPTGKETGNAITS